MLIFHITFLGSLDSTAEVVKKLLHKFNITDDPKQFALLEQTLDGESEGKISGYILSRNLDRQTRQHNSDLKISVC